MCMYVLHMKCERENFAHVSGHRGKAGTGAIEGEGEEKAS